jgi:sarcosine oxidase
MLYGLPDQGQGLKLAEHHGGTRTSPEEVVREVTPAEREAFLAFASPWIDRLPGQPADASVCLYTNTPDGDFVLDWHPAARDVYLVSACSGHGFKFAPAIGEAVVSELLDVATGFDLAPFRISRFLV